MKIIWDMGEASVAQVKEVYQAQHRLAYTTIMTVLSRLERKGILKQRKSGKAFFYSAAYSREDLAEAAVDTLVRIFFNGSRDHLVEFCGGAKRSASPKRLRPASSVREAIDETLL